MLILLAFMLGLGLVGATVMVVVTIPATRQGAGPWTWWAKRRAERSRRLAQRPVATAEERFARGISLRRLLAPLLLRLPRRRRRGAPQFLSQHGERPRGPRRRASRRARVEAAAGAPGSVAAAERAATLAESIVPAPADPVLRPRRGLKVDERHYVAQVEARCVAQIQEQADLVNEIVVMTKKRIPMPEVIEADPIDADIVNPRILAGSS